MFLLRAKMAGIIVVIAVGLLLKDAGLLVIGWHEMFMSLLGSLGFAVKTDKAQEAGKALFKDLFLLAPRIFLALGVLAGWGGVYVDRLVPVASPHVHADLVRAGMVRPAGP